MIRIGILGDIGAGKTYVSNCFRYPVFNADFEVSKLYKDDKRVFNKLKKKLPKHISSFPVQKKEIVEAILKNEKNFKKVIHIIHMEIQKKMNLFLKKNKKKKIIILDIPLLLENNINKQDDILVFVQANQADIKKRLLKRKNFNKKLFRIFKKMQLPLSIKKNRSDFIIKNNFKSNSVKHDIKNILKQILK